MRLRRVLDELLVLLCRVCCLGVALETLALAAREAPLACPAHACPWDGASPQLVPKLVDMSSARIDFRERVDDA